MEIQEISSWSQIVDVINQIQYEYGKTEVVGEVEHHLILYRGLSDSNWQLDTTLERYSNNLWTVKTYYRLIYYCAPHVESFLGTSWNLGTAQDMEKNLDNNFYKYSVNPPHYEYWAYLRHHGFPSPLLDWTKSPYVALFFALCEQSKAEYASLYAYIERPEGFKGKIVGAPMITVLYPYVRTHKRHFLQQSYYTVATEIKDEASKDHEFIPHEKIFQTDNKRQDLLIKIVFPRSIRIEALTQLETYNINYYSLFQTEDALIKSVALKELELPLGVAN